MAPEDVTNVASCVATDLAGFQVMEAESREALDAWIARWSDVVDFEVVPVITSAEASGTGAVAVLDPEPEAGLEPTACRLQGGCSTS